MKEIVEKLHSDILTIANRAMQASMSGTSVKKYLFALWAHNHVEHIVRNEKHPFYGWL